jgi:hypothetical protein
MGKRMVTAHETRDGVALREDFVTQATGAVAQITDEDFPSGADSVAFMDSYYIVNDSGTDQFFISSLDDGTTWDGLDFASAEGNPDDIVTILVDHRELWLFGSKTTEVWYDSGDPDFPFERLQGAFIECGCIAVGSVAKASNAVLWLGNDLNGSGIVWIAQGYNPQRVSTHAIEEEIQKYARMDDAQAYVYQDGGHTFYVLSFPTGNKTWVLDIATGLWHERSWRDPSTGAVHRHRAQFHAFFGGEHVVGGWIGFC